MDKQITYYEQAVDDLFHKRLKDTARSELKTTPRKHLIVERAFYRLRVCVKFTDFAGTAAENRVNQKISKGFMKRLSLLTLFFVVGLCGCETINPLCTENYCVEGKIYGKSLLPEDAEYGELPINDSQLLGAITGTPVDPIANFTGSYPHSGSTVSNSAVIKVFFDNQPAGVIVTYGEVEKEGNPRFRWDVYGNELHISLWNSNDPYVGHLELTITWANGSKKLQYHVIEPDLDRPRVVSGTVTDGDTNVDPEIINGDGIIEIQFSEEVSGYIALQNEDGDDAGWIGRVEGNKARLEVVKGREIGYSTTYVIVGKVNDAAGNETTINITFVTMIDE